MHSFIQLFFRKPGIKSGFALTALAVPLFAARALSQTTASTQQVALTSSVLGEARTLDISTPVGYERSSERYPVIVVLDGESQHEVVAAIAHFYASVSTMPPAIVVGVRNTRRSRDLTPAAQSGFTPPPNTRGSGGADRFLSFLVEEALPYLESHYRTTPMRVLVGHSLGGLLALHALGTRPEAFTGYIVMEPAVWWNNEFELRAAQRALTTPSARHARLMLVNATMSGMDTTRWGGDAPMIRVMRVSGESHESMPAAGALLAFRRMFEDFRPAEWKPGTKPVAMIAHYDSLSARVGYAVRIPERAFQTVVEMSIFAREFADAAEVLGRMRQAFGTTPAVTDLQNMLDMERAEPAPAAFIPLEIPPRRPTAAAAQAFLGRWVKVGGGSGHEISVVASGDTIVVHDRAQLPNGEWDEGDHQVIQVTPSGRLEWGLPWFRGVPALLVLKAEMQKDGTMRVTREARGWVPRGPSGDFDRVDVFQKRTDGPAQ